MKTYKPGPITKADEKRLAAYQKAEGLKVDGEPGHQSVNTMLDQIAVLKGKLHECRNKPGPNVAGLVLIGVVVGFGIGAILFLGPM